MPTDRTDEFPLCCIVAIKIFGICYLSGPFRRLAESISNSSEIMYFYNNYHLNSAYSCDIMKFSFSGRSRKADRTLAEQGNMSHCPGRYLVFCGFWRYATSLGRYPCIYILLNPHSSGYPMLSLPFTLAPVVAILSLLLFAKNVPALSLASSILPLDWILDTKECPNL